MAKLTQDQMLEAFASMTVLRARDFKKAFEDKFGVVGRRPGCPPRRRRRPGCCCRREVEEQTEFPRSS